MAQRVPIDPGSLLALNLGASATVSGLCHGAERQSVGRRGLTIEVPKAVAGVGSTKIFENDRIIVWEFVLEPGESTPVHTHQHDYVWHVLEGSKLETFDESGRSIGAFNSNTGDTFSFKCVGSELVSTDEKGLRGPATHSARNAGATRYREILVEMKA